MKALAALRLCTFLLLATSVPVTAQDGPAVSIAEDKGAFKVHASITLPLEPCAAWRLLTDYQNLPGFVPGLLQVRVKRISPTRVDVWQEGEVDVLFFQVKLATSLEMEETPNRRIVFRQTEGDLQSYSGAWDLSKAESGTRVSYDAAITLKPEQLMPAFLTKSVLEDEVRKRFEAIGKEASKRKNKTVPACVSGK